MSFRLWSNDLKEGGRMPEAQVFNGMGYSGGNRSPHLAWEGAPAGTKSFVLTVYDPDAPTGSGWWHWVVANIPATAKELPADSGSGKGLPAGALETERTRDAACLSPPRSRWPIQAAQNPFDSFNPHPVWSGNADATAKSCRYFIRNGASPSFTSVPSLNRHRGP